MVSYTTGDKFIKASARIILYSLFVFLFSYCEDESSQPRSYPRVLTMAVSDISKSGAKFSAEILSLGSEDIIEHGFVWGITTYPTLQYSNKTFMGRTDRTGLFTADIGTSLAQGVKYSMRPFLQTSEHLIYGPIVDFVSLGSGSPEITGFMPHTAGWKDTLYIKGRNFSWITSENSVRLDNELCNVLASTDSTLTITVETNIVKIKNILSVELAGNRALYTKDTFSLKPPVLKDFNPKTACWGDTLYLSGRSLKFVTSKQGNYIKLGPYSCSMLGSKNDSTIAIRIPNEITTLSSNITILINGFNLQGSTPFTLKAPEFTFSPKSGTWGSTITLTGKINSNYSRNSVYFDNISAAITSTSAKELKVQVPDGLSAIKSKIIYKAEPFTITSADTFRLNAPVITSFSPVKGPSGSTVVIKGKYFKSWDTSVKFGTIAGTITSNNDSIINVTVPSGINGPCKISVKVKLQTTISSADFTVANPKITTVSPLTGTFNDEVTISGENLIPPSGTATIAFGGIPATIKSATETAIVAYVPLTMDSIPRKIELNPGLNSISSLSKFTLSPPVISSISPVNFSPEQDITITGQNFNPVAGNNKVFWGIYQLTVKNATSNVLVASLAGLPGGLGKISVIVGGYMRVHPKVYEIISNWTPIVLPASFVWNSGSGLNQNGISGVIKGIGHLVEHSEVSITGAGRMTSYNPATNEFVNRGSQSYILYGNGRANVVNRDTLYSIFKDSYYYAPNLGMWINDSRMNLLPASNRSNGVAFSLNGQIYFGLGFNTGTNTLEQKIWSFDSGTKKWTAKSDFPGFSSQYAVGYFTINNKGYVLFLDNVFCEYDPLTDKWTKLAPFPGPGALRTGRVSFVLNNLGYVGLGKNSTQAYDDFWAYYPVTNVWSEETRMPLGGRYNSIAFVINNKAYIGFGYKSSTQLRDLYVFDPIYIFK
jgi:hypothetical protein